MVATIQTGKIISFRNIDWRSAWRSSCSLISSKTGKKMRKELNEKYCEASDHAKDVCDDVCDQAKDLVDKARCLAEDAKDIAASLMKESRARSTLFLNDCARAMLLWSGNDPFDDQIEVPWSLTESVNSISS